MGNGRGDTLQVRGVDVLGYGGFFEDFIARGSDERGVVGGGGGGGGSGLGF